MNGPSRMFGKRLHKKKLILAFVSQCQDPADGHSGSTKGRSKNGKMGRLRRSDGLVLDRPYLHGDGGYRYGLWANLDRNLIRGGKMREAIIIGTILILAVIIWRPRKGGKE